MSAEPSRGGIFISYSEMSPDERLAFDLGYAAATEQAKQREAELVERLERAERQMKHCSEVLQSLVAHAEEYEEAAGDGPDLSGVIANVAEALAAHQQNDPSPTASAD